MLKSVEDLTAEQRNRVASEKGITDIEEDLKSATTTSEALKDSIAKDATELKKLKVDYQEATTQARAAKQEVRQATGKLYLLFYYNVFSDSKHSPC